MRDVTNEQFRVLHFLLFASDQSSAMRVGDEVRRSSRPFSPFEQTLLAHGTL